MSRAVLEAMACAVVPIVSENCGYTDIIQNNINGFVVPIRSSYLIEEKIKYLSDNPAILKSIRERSLQTAISFPGINIMRLSKTFIIPSQMFKLLKAKLIKYLFTSLVDSTESP